MTAVLLVNEGLMHYEREDPPRAEPVWREAYAIASQMEDEYVARLDNLGCLALMVGDLARAEACLEATVEQSRSAGGAVDEAVFLADLGETRRRLGRLDEAEAMLLKAIASHRILGNSLRLGEATVYLGRLRQDQGRREEARRLFQASLHDLERSHGTRLLSHAYVHLGILDALEGKQGEALSSFRSALEHAQSDVQARLKAAQAGLRKALGASAYDTRWSEALARPIRDRAHRTLQELTPPARPRASALPAGAALEVRAFGETRVVLGGRILGPADWTYVKSKELLFYMLSYKSATKAQIGLDLWPEASPGQLRSAFHSALHHLRRALGGSGWISFVGGRYAFDRLRPFKYAVQDFEDLIRRAREEA